MVQEGQITGSAFQFHKGRDRQDGFLEASINWEDEEDVIKNTLSQQDPNKEQKFRFGVAVLSRGKIDWFRENTVPGQLVSYERRIIKGENPHHGNLLMKANAGKIYRGLIASHLAAISFYIPQSNQRALITSLSPKGTV